MKGSDAVVACFFGDGAACEGIFHEALNLAAVWKLPVLFVCENNEWQAFVHRRETMLTENIASRAAGYGIEGRTVDGNDAEAVFAAAAKAVARIRDTKMPFLLETKTYRLRGHFEPDDQGYVDKDELASWRRRDPIENLRARLVSSGTLTTRDAAAIERRVAERLDAAFAFAADSPWPSLDQLTTDVYA
jgi:pyruvate dehydrogenase E1 component alpha subunit